MTRFRQAVFTLPGWNAGDFPFVNVARIVIPAPQKHINSKKAEAECEKLVFTPCHSLAAHQPLGGINRLRKAVYLASKDHRGGGAKRTNRSKTFTGSGRKARKVERR